MGLKGPYQGIWTVYRPFVFLASAPLFLMIGLVEAPLMLKTPKREEEEEQLFVHTRLPPCGIWWRKEAKTPELSCFHSEAHSELFYPPAPLSFPRLHTTTVL